MRRKRKLYGNNIQPACEYCAFGKLSSDGNAILCPRKGVMPLYHSCRRFDYDPLKRIPKRRKPIQQFDKTDFQL